MYYVVAGAREEEARHTMPSGNLKILLILFVSMLQFDATCVGAYPDVLWLPWLG